MFERRTQLLATIALATLLPLAATATGAAPLPDPTRPPTLAAPRTESAPATAWRLTSILFSPSRRVAIINGQPAAEGDVVKGATVIAIRADAVDLRRHDGRRFTVHLETGLVKQPPQVVNNNQGKQTP